MEKILGCGSEALSPGKDIFEAYREVKKQNEKLINVAQSCAFIFGNEANYPEGTIGYRLAKDAKEALKNAE